MNRIVIMVTNSIVTEQDSRLLMIGEIKQLKGTAYLVVEARARVGSNM